MTNKSTEPVDCPTPKGKFARGSILGSAVARVSAAKVTHALVQPFRKPEHKLLAAQKSDAAAAKVLFDACGTLRGTALKLLQVLATEPELVPEAYREEFSKASHRATPINRALVRKILQSELGSSVERFQRFDSVPFAAASLGQVHAATSHEGMALAVKIQYPGMAEGVASDLTLLRAVLRPTRFGRTFESCFTELRDRLTEELDYRREAEHTAWFYDHLRLNDVVVPQVQLEHSTQRVLTTEYIAGQHVAEWLTSGPSQSTRNRYGQLLVDLFHHSLYDLHCIHADPNWGNYLFRTDGKLGLLDFGCVRKLEPEFAESIQLILHGPPLDPDALERVHADLGVHYRSNVASLELREFLGQWGEWIAEPYRANVFDFSQATDYFTRGMAMSHLAQRFLRRYEGSFLYFGRAHHGLLRLLHTLGAKVRMGSPLSLERLNQAR